MLAVIIANELRSDAVQGLFMEVFQQTFTLKKIARAKLAVITAIPPYNFTY